MTTRIGQIILKVPKHRGDEAFKTFVFDNYCRSEAALIVTMAEMCVNGVSTRKVSQVMEILCGKSFSKSTVSEVCKELDEKVKEFRERPLSGEYPFMSIDAAYFKVRENSRVISKAFMIAYAANSEGYRKGLAGELQDMFHCKTIEAARKRRDEIIADYKDVAEEAMTCLDESFEAAMTVMVLPGYRHKYFRTSNQIERLNKERKRRSKVIGVFPKEDSLMRLIGAVLMERNDYIASLRCVFKASTLQEPMASDLPLKLVKIAKEQRQLLAA